MSSSLLYLTDQIGNSGPVMNTSRNPVDEPHREKRLDKDTHSPQAMASLDLAKYEAISVLGVLQSRCEVYRAMTGSRSGIDYEHAILD